MAVAIGIAAAAAAWAAPRSGGQPLLPIVDLLAGEAKVPIQAEVARTSEQMARGLMQVTRLNDNAGMLFVYESPTQASFYMLNTLIPLTIAYLDSRGVIREIHDMTPLDETPVLSQKAEIQYVLEMNRNWFKINGIKVGDRIAPASGEWKDVLNSAAGLKNKGTPADNS